MSRDVQNHKHFIPPSNKCLPLADSPKECRIVGKSNYCDRQERNEYVRPTNEKQFIEGIRSIIRSVKRMKKSRDDWCSLYGHLHYREADDWKKNMAPKEKLLDWKMLKALKSRPPKSQCNCACFCPIVKDMDPQYIC